MRRPPLREMRFDSLHCMQSISMFPIKHVRNLDLLDGTPEIPKKHCHKPTRTMMSLQECEIALCTPNQIEMSPITLHWLQSHATLTSYMTSCLTSVRQLQRIPETPVSSPEEHQFQHSN